MFLDFLKTDYLFSYLNIQICLYDIFKYTVPVPSKCRVVRWGTGSISVARVAISVLISNKFSRYQLHVWTYRFSIYRTEK